MYIRVCSFTTGISLRFEHSAYTVQEDAGDLGNTVSIIKENGMVSERTLAVLLRANNGTSHRSARQGWCIFYSEEPMKLNCYSIPINYVGLLLRINLSCYGYAQPRYFLLTILLCVDRPLM